MDWYSDGQPGTHPEAHTPADAHTHADAHIHADAHTHGEQHLHEELHMHSHYHAPEEKKKQMNRLAKAIGHLQHVKGMIEADEDCSQVLMQLAAVESALHSLGKEIINEHMTHCITHAIEDGDTQAVEEFQKAISKYM